MATSPQDHLALSDSAARQLANATKTTAQLSTIITPLAGPPAAVGSGRGRHLPAEQGRQRRVDRCRVPDPGRVGAAADLRALRESPAEYFLNSVATVLDVHTRVSDLYSSPL